MPGAPEPLLWYECLIDSISRNAPLSRLSRISFQATRAVPSSVLSRTSRKASMLLIFRWSFTRESILALVSGNVLETRRRDSLHFFYPSSGGNSCFSWPLSSSTTRNAPLVEETNIIPATPQLKVEQWDRSIANELIVGQRGPRIRDICHDGSSNPTVQCVIATQSGRSIHFTCQCHVGSQHTQFEYTRM